MSRADGPSAQLPGQVRRWLAAAQGHRASLRSLLRKARAESAIWVPALIRVAGEDRSAVGGTAAALLIRLVSEAENEDQILEVYDRLPHQATQLAEVALAATARLLELFPKLERLRGREAALLWNNLSVRCRQNGQVQAALQAAEVAVEVAGACATDQGGRRLLAQCLLTAASEQAAHGLHEAALATAERACSLTVELNRNGSRKDVVIELQAWANRAHRLAAVGRKEEAITCARSLRSRMLSLLPEPALGQSLALVELTLGACYSDLDRPARGLPHAEAADRLFRVLGGNRPGEFIDYTLAAGNNYADALLATGDVETAHRVLVQAVARAEPFVERQPTRFGRDFSILQMGLGDTERRRGNLDEAIHWGRTALRSIRAYGRRSGKRDWQVEGSIANNLFHALYQAGQVEAGAKCARLALRCFDRLPKTSAEAQALRAQALRYLAQITLQAAKRGAVKRAVGFARHALETALGSPRPSPARGRLVEAQCRTTLAHCLEEEGGIEEAIKEQQAALGILGELHSHGMESHRADLAYSLYRLSRLLLKNGDYLRAKAAAQDSVGLYERVVQHDKEGRIAFLADGLRNLAEAHLALHEEHEAMASFERAVRVLRPEYEGEPGKWMPFLLPLCIRYVQMGEALAVPWDLSLVADVIHQARTEPEQR